METLKQNVVSRLTSRKLWVAVLAACGALGAALQDGVVSLPEVYAIMTPLLAFIGVEGVKDIKEA